MVFNRRLLVLILVIITSIGAGLILTRQQSEADVSGGTNFELEAPRVNLAALGCGFTDKQCLTEDRGQGQVTYGDSFAESLVEFSVNSLPIMKTMACQIDVLEKDDQGKPKKVRVSINNPSQLGYDCPLKGDYLTQRDDFIYFDLPFSSSVSLTESDVAYQGDEYSVQITPNSSGAVNATGTARVKIGSSNGESYLILGISTINTKGTFEGSVKYDLQSSDDRTQNLSAIDHRFQIDDTSGQYLIVTKGSVSTNYAGSFSQDETGVPKVVWSKLEFCPVECFLEVSRTIKVKAVARPEYAKSSLLPSKVFLQSYVNETTSGTGNADASTGVISWSDDYKLENVIKNDWSVFYTPNNSNSSSDEGLIDYTVTTIPAQKAAPLFFNKSFERRLVFDGFQSEFGTVPMTYTVNGSNVLTELDENTSSPPSYSGSISLNGQLIGEISTDADVQRFFMSPENEYGFMGMPHYFQDQYLFRTRMWDFGDASSQGSSGFSSSSIPALPAEIWFLDALGPKDQVLFAEDIIAIKEFANELSKHTKVVYKQATDPSSYLGIVESAPTNKPVWFFSVAHGAPTGILAGDRIPTEESDFPKDSKFAKYENAVNNHSIPFSVIKEVLPHGARLDVFGGISCYAGNSDIAPVTIGSIGPTISGVLAKGALLEANTNIGALFGITGNYFTYTVDRIIERYRSLLTMTTAKCSNNDGGNTGDDEGNHSEGGNIKNQTTPVVETKKIVEEDSTQPQTTLLIKPEITPEQVALNNLANKRSSIKDQIDSLNREITSLSSNLKTISRRDRKSYKQIMTAIRSKKKDLRSKAALLVVVKKQENTLRGLIKQYNDLSIKVDRYEILVSEEQKRNMKKIRKIQLTNYKRQKVAVEKKLSSLIEKNQ